MSIRVKKVTIHQDDKKYTLRLSDGENDSLYAALIAILSAHDVSIEELRGLEIKIDKDV